VSQRERRTYGIESAGTEGPSVPRLREFPSEIENRVQIPKSFAFWTPLREQSQRFLRDFLDFRAITSQSPSTASPFSVESKIVRP
jgi:hypothetical protein